MKQRLNKGQIQLIQVAVRAAGIRGEVGDKRYRLVLAQYTKPSGGPCTSSKDLDPQQMEDLLALCESMGFRMLGKSATCCRDKVAMRAIDGHRASAGQQAGLRHLYQDLGWHDYQFRGFVDQFTQGRCKSELTLTRQDAWGLTEAMKAMLLRQTGIKAKNLKDIQTSMEAINDGKETG
jgi:hypothetical protein